MLRNHDYGKLSGRVMDDLWKQHASWKGRMKKEIRRILLYGNRRRRNISCAGKARGAKVSPAGILNALQWLQNIWAHSLIFMAAAWIFCFRIMKVKLRKAPFAIIQPPAKYWMHNNMITVNGKKMGKSYNNQIKLTEMFSGDHPLLTQAFHPMTIRFFILQTHYRSTLDFSSEALLAAEKGLKRLWEAYEVLKKLTGGSESVGNR